MTGRVNALAATDWCAGHMVLQPRLVRSYWPHQVVLHQTIVRGSRGPAAVVGAIVVVIRAINAIRHGRRCRNSITDVPVLF